MLYEFAVEPRVLYCAARSPRDYRDFVHWFEVGEPNVISGYPVFKKFKSEVYKKKPSDLTDIDLTRLDDLVKFVGETLRVNRSAIYDKGKAWIDNIKIEDRRSHFDHVLTLETEAGLSGLSCLTAQQFFEGVPPGYPRQRSVTRTADEMAKALQNLLRLSSRIIFIDPYFKAHFPCWDPFIKFIEVALMDAPDDQLDIEVIFCNSYRVKYRSTLSLAAKFRDEHSGLSSRCNVRFIAIKETEGKEKIHNRYILTDIGGVSFGVGLAEEDKSHQDDVCLLNDTLYNLRWRQYACGSYFDVVEDTTV